ncbi:hypothetical protein GCM10008959_06110 [Deinococcus seoulensis]|uniref:Spy/CpxP family protein refolding chaperone n=1 Tax=Deinococcus seoulensis TaxID=1837379 RepID=A0ABQ2RLR6_9DEIO|nr:hypothetical protein [Deinococcus seoulensis]GGR47689.1 hypothetical protein GCM10008959_06110 [Deinococcus seoulensis]
MNKTLPARLVPAALTLTALTLGAASAQQTGQRQMTPEMQARMKAMQPITDLAQTVRLLPDLEKNRATALTKAQAAQLLPILTTLQKAAAVQPNDAKKYLTQIEDKILTAKQLTALDGLFLKAEKEREAQRAQRQSSGQNAGTRIPGLPGGVGGFGGNRSGGQNAQGQNGQGGQPGQFNPFKQERTAEQLKAYVALLKKK